MLLNRIYIKNFRNFSELDVKLAGNVVIVGENRIGKSNLLYGLRLILDPTLPDSARQLSQSDFWDGIENPGVEDKIVISIEIIDFANNPGIHSQLTDYRINDDPETVRLTYEFRPKSGIDGAPTSDDDYKFICYGGEDDSNRFGHDLRRRISLDLLPALRDAESELANWRRSPLKPLIESAFGTVDRDDLDDIQKDIESATARLGGFSRVEKLEKNLGKLFKKMSGPKQDVKPTLGFGATDITRLYRNIRLLIDEGKRNIGDASLGSANIVFLTLKILELKQQIKENQRNHTLLAIEEPEAHLHPHLQRSIYRHLFENISIEIGEKNESSLSIILTTHSPHIASIAPFNSILLLKNSDDGGTVGFSTTAIELNESDRDDLTRYLDVTRAEMLFAGGVILVEGDAEKFLLPVFAETIGHSLDHLGITVCSVSGTNFIPYAKFLTALDIPFSIATDWDPQIAKRPLGFRRSLKLIETILYAQTGSKPIALIEELNAIEDFDDFGKQCEEYGIFTNNNTLEIDLFKHNFTDEIIDTLREYKFSKERQNWIDEWEIDNRSLDSEKYFRLIERIGKGRFAQRLASRIANIQPPNYIKGAIEYVVNRV